MEAPPISIILSFISGLELHIFSLDVALCFIVIVIFICCSALVSGSEVAFFSLSSKDLEDINNNRVKKLLDKPNELLATILIVNNFINVGIVVVSAYLTSIALKFPDNSNLEFIFQVVVITTVLVLFGEITPKVYANNNAKYFSKLMSRPLMVLKKIFSPLIYVLVTTTTFIDRRLILRNHEVSVEDITKALDITEHESQEDERRMLRSIVEFGNTDVKEVMCSRVDVLAIEQDTKFKEVLNIIIRSGFSRIPVFKEQFDHVVGILYIKDLIPHLNETDNFHWISLCRQPFFVPETKMINDLLKDFQLKKNHMAIVVDEYGGTSGIVTLEDLLEEIVGEINDEFDIDENIYSKLDERTYIFEGKILLNDFIKIVKGDIDSFEKVKGDADSLAGLVLEIEGRIPKIGNVCKVPPYTIIVESSDARRIKRLKVIIDDC